MDRNLDAMQVIVIVMVALRKESVDRNLDAVQVIVIVMESLSARRAWIEIMICIDKVPNQRRRSPQGERG